MALTRARHALLLVGNASALQVPFTTYSAAFSPIYSNMCSNICVDCVYFNARAPRPPGRRQRLRSPGGFHYIEPDFFGTYTRGRYPKYPPYYTLGVCILNPSLGSRSFLYTYGPFKYTLGVVLDVKRMNVALTRARHALLLVGNASALQVAFTTYSAAFSPIQRQRVFQYIPIYSNMCSNICVYCVYSNIHSGSCGT